MDLKKLNEYIEKNKKEFYSNMHQQHIHQAHAEICEKEARKFD